MAQFHHSVAPDGSVVVQVAGEVDLSAIEDLVAAVRPSLVDGRSVEIDLSGLEFIDSSGLGSLVQLLKEANRKGASFALTNVSASTYRLLEVTGLATVFQVEASLPDPDDVVDT